MSVKSITLKDEGFTGRTPAGLTDGGHVFLRCSNCRAYLLDFWINKPDAPFIWKVKAKNCPFCDEKGEGHLGGSFIEEIKGGFAGGGYGVTKSDDPEDSVMSTVDDGWVDIGDVLVFNVKKADEKAQAVRI